MSEIKVVTLKEAGEELTADREDAVVKAAVGETKVCDKCQQEKSPLHGRLVWIDGAGAHLVRICDGCLADCRGLPGCTAATEKTMAEIKAAEKEDNELLDAMLSPADELTKLGQEAGDYDNPPGARGYRVQLDDLITSLEEYDTDITHLIAITPEMPAEEKASLENRALMMRTQRNKAMNALTLLAVLERGKIMPDQRRVVEKRLAEHLKDLSLFSHVTKPGNDLESGLEPVQKG